MDFKVDFGRRLHGVYTRGRELPAETLAAWAEAFTRHAPAGRPLRVLDLGSGTGRFTPALAEAFGGPVTGVEPSAGMRAEAERVSAHPAVGYVPGRAEAIPLPDGRCDLVLCFLVLHHAEDLPKAVAEIARVLRPGGRALIRCPVADPPAELLWHGFFPRAREIERVAYPTDAELRAVFAATPLALVATAVVRQRLAENLADYAARLRLRAISTFDLLTEQETEAGFALLDEAVARETVPAPVEEDCDLLVFERR